MKENDNDNDKKEQFITPQSKKLENLELEKEQKIKETMQLNVNEPKNLDIDYYGQANCISSLFYHWAFKIIRLSHKVKINIQHLGVLKGKNSSSNFFTIYKSFFFHLNKRSSNFIT